MSFAKRTWLWGVSHRRAIAVIGVLVSLLTFFTHDKLTARLQETSLALRDGKADQLRALDHFSDEEVSAEASERLQRLIEPQIVAPGDFFRYLLDSRDLARSYSEIDKELLDSFDHYRRASLFADGALDKDRADWEKQYSRLVHQIGCVEEVSTLGFMSYQDKQAYIKQKKPECSEAFGFSPMQLIEQRDLELYFLKSYGQGVYLHAEFRLQQRKRDLNRLGIINDIVFLLGWLITLLSTILDDKRPKGECAPQA